MSCIQIVAATKYEIKNIRGSNTFFDIFHNDDDDDDDYAGCHYLIFF